MAMKKAAGLVLIASCFVLAADDKEKEAERLTASYDVMREILGTDKGIPTDLLDKSECVVVFPGVKKGAFLVGGSYGRGAMVCRTGEHFDGGAWTAPAMFALEGASFGFQAGVEETDFVLLVMNEKGANSVMSSKVKLGADAAIAAGPVGRDVSAETDAVMKAEILSWSRARGVFGGISLKGSTLRSDDDANKNVYGKKLDAKQILKQNAVKPTPEGQKLVDLLQMTSPKHGTTGESERIAK